MCRVIALLVALVALSACGSKGPLYLPKPSQTAPAASPATPAVPADDSKNPGVKQ